jgi:hypothetical protein
LSEPRGAYALMVLIVGPFREIIRNIIHEVPDIVQQRGDDQVRWRALLLSEPRSLQSVLGNGDALTEVSLGATFPENSHNVISNAQGTAPG